MLHASVLAVQAQAVSMPKPMKSSDLWAYLLIPVSLGALFFLARWWKDRD